MGFVVHRWETLFLKSLKNAQIQGARNPQQRGVLYAYAATTEDEGNAADVRFSATCQKEGGELIHKTTASFELPL